jgi:hypothetical protein
VVDDQVDPVFVALVFHVEIVGCFNGVRKARRKTNRAETPEVTHA